MFENEKIFEKVDKSSKKKLPSAAGVKRNSPNFGIPKRGKRNVGRPKKKIPPLRSIAHRPYTSTFFSIPK